MYVFYFDCYNKPEKLTKYDNQLDQLDVHVIADTEAQALEKVSELVKREVYELEYVKELTQLNAP